MDRIGQVHQAGSDSLLTAQTFFKLKHVVFGNELEKQNFKDLAWVQRHVPERRWGFLVIKMYDE